MRNDLCQPVFLNLAQRPKFQPTSLAVPYLAAPEPANLEGPDFTTHTGTHIDAPFHCFLDLEPVDRLPLDHFHTPRVVLGLIHKVREAAPYPMISRP